MKKVRTSEGSDVRTRFCLNVWVCQAGTWCPCGRSWIRQVYVLHGPLSYWRPGPFSASCLCTSGTSRYKRQELGRECSRAASAPEGSGHSYCSMMQKPRLWWGRQHELWSTIQELRWTDRSGWNSECRVWEKEIGIQTFFDFEIIGDRTKKFWLTWRKLLEYYYFEHLGKQSPKDGRYEGVMSVHWWTVRETLLCLHHQY